jgi:MFS family permease
VLYRFAMAALSVLLGFHLYQLTHDPLTLGWLGLAQALPAVTLVLYGGVIADRHSRRSVTLLGRAAYAGLAALLALGTLADAASMVWIIYATGFLLGCAAAFTSPAVSGLEAEVVPAQGAMRSVSLMGSAAQAAGLAGPVIGSFFFGRLGAGQTYLGIAVLLAVSGVIILGAVPNVAAPPRAHGDGALTRMAEGIRYVAADQVLLGSMALDLFAVFFGGAAALLPIFATDILHVGPTGFGFLRAAISVGSLLAMLITVRHPPRLHAGLALHVAIAGFGVGIIVFALSRNFALSLLALATVGACDGVSMVIRQGIMRLAAPGPLRGRIAAVRSVFVTSSNELGDFESGMLAAAVGAVPAVWLGGVVTLAVVGFTAWRAPRLRRLDLGRMEALAARA